jgi:hypothetical protein
MTKLIRMTALAASAAALTLAATPAAAAPTGPAAGSRNATAMARIVKPLVLTWVQDMNFGTILQSGAGTWSGAVVKVELNGTRTCANTNVVCSGAFSTARYNVTGTNNQRVFITAPDFDLTNANDGSKLTLTVDKGLGYVDLANSGNVGQNFDLGGSITVNSSTTGGVYTGTFNVTVDY